MGIRVSGLDFRVKSYEIRVQGQVFRFEGFEVSDLGFRILGFRVLTCTHCNSSATPLDVRSDSFAASLA